MSRSRANSIAVTPQCLDRPVATVLTIRLTMKLGTGLYARL